MQHMNLTTDQNTINSALKLFSITAQDYYLEFTDTAVLMHWIAGSSLVNSYLQGDFVALDVQVRGLWREATSITSVPSGYYNCRYILEV
jgi:hypothetical protein